MKKTIVTLTMLTLSLWSTGSALAGGYPWRDHAPPFDFTFGNDFDMHQQSQELGTGELQGFQYIKFTGVSPEGYPIAVHGPATVGWIMHGIPGMAMLVQFDPMGHHLWLVDPADLPRQAGYVHFHWVGGPLTPGDVGNTFEGFFLKHTAISTFFFMPHGFLVTPGIDDTFAPNIVESWP